MRPWFHPITTKRLSAVVVLVFVIVISLRAQAFSSAQSLAHKDADAHQASNQTPEHLDAIIIGGGIVGLATSVALLERTKSVKIKVYERANTFRPMGALLGFFPNGQTALQHISPSVWQRVKASSLSCIGVQQRNLNGDIVSQREIGAGALYLVWFVLQQELRNELPEGVLCLASEFIDYQVHENHDLILVRIRNRSTNEIDTKTCRVLIGADGIHSKVRRQLADETKQTPELRFHNRVMHRAVIDMDLINKRFHPPPGMTVSFVCGEPGKTFAVRETAKGILTFTSTIVTDAPIGDKSTHEEIKKRLEQWFKGYPEHVQHIMDVVPSSAIHENSVFDIDFMDQWSSGPVVLVGDAAHAMTPALGQGANVGLEDAVELASILSPVLANSSKNDEKIIARALTRFCDVRRDRVKHIHFASREHSTARSQRDKGRHERNMKFYEWMWNWEPSFAHSSNGAAKSN